MQWSLLYKSDHGQKAISTFERLSLYFEDPNSTLLNGRKNTCVTILQSCSESNVNVTVREISARRPFLIPPPCESRGKVPNFDGNRTVLTPLRGGGAG